MCRVSHNEESLPGGPIIRIMPFGGLYWGTLILGNYYVDLS